MANSSDDRGRGFEVHAPARLHFGFLDLNGGLGRRFASLGVALDAPGLRLVATPCQDLCVAGPEADRLRRYVEAAAAHLGVPARGTFSLRETIPSHAGFGSGTQLALASAAALARLEGLSFDGPAAAAALDRGNRSGIGLAAFETGGLLLDGGRGPDESPPPIIARLPFPEEWRIVLILDERLDGVHGSAETAAFAGLPPFPAGVAADLCRLAVMKILPAAATGDIARFGSGIAEIQRRVGDHFAPVQGGRFTSPRVAAALEACEDRGIAGVGQSSWGPTGYALVASDAQARALVRDLSRLGLDLAFAITRGRNRGAAVTELAPDGTPSNEERGTR